MNESGLELCAELGGMNVEPLAPLAVVPSPTGSEAQYRVGF